MSFLRAQALRLLWHINRSPARWVIKAALRLKHQAEVRVRMELAQRLPADAVSEQLARDLDRDGYVRLDGVLDASRLGDLDAAASAKLARVERDGLAASTDHKKFWSRLLDEDMIDGRLAIDSPFVRFAIQPRVVGIISRVLGQVPKLDYVLLTLSRESDGPLSFSQLWHRDHDDVRVIKLFVYLTDVVDMDDGPFTFIPGPVSDRFGFALHSHRPDEVIFKRAAPGDVKTMIAPRLATFLVETSRCMHMGSRMAPGHTRLLYTATFFSVPRMFPNPPPRFGATEGLDDVGRKLLAPI